MHTVLAQAKRQALLAYLAVAVPRGFHRRDTLLGLLWPDRNEEDARAALSKATSHLRQALGADALLSRGHGELGLDWHRVWCDAAGFEEALDRGEAAEAMALYHGDLLPGFYIEGVPEFDQWVERERSRLRGRAVQACRLLSEREETAGRHSVAVDWARRAATLEPFDESAVRRIMQLLDACGDRAGALRTYEEFAARLNAELETAPSEATVALMEAIRDRVVPSGDRRPEAGSAPPATAVAREPEARHRLPVVAIAAAATVIAIVGYALFANTRTPGAETEVASVAVLPFVVQGGVSSPVGDLGHAMVTLLSERLNHSNVLRAIDSRTIRSIARPVSLLPSGADSARVLVAGFRPRFVLVGEIETHGDSLRVDAALFDSVSTKPIARASATGGSDDLATLASDLAWQLISARPTRRSALWNRSPGALTPSVPALRAFLAGEQAYVAGHFVEAARNYKAAVDADSTFALAYLYLGRAANWTGDYAMESFATQRAFENVDRLMPGDQLLVQAWHAYLLGQPVETERMSRLLTVNEPAMFDAWYALGEVRFHYGPVLGWSVDEARDAYERAAVLSPAAGVLVHLVRIAASQHRPSAADSLARAALATGVDRPQSLEVRALRAYAAGDRAEIARVNSDIAGLDEGASQSLLVSVATYAAGYDGVSAFVSLLRRAERTPDHRATAAIIAAQLAMARGRAGDAERILVSGPDLVATRALEYRAALAVLPFRDVPAAKLAQLRGEIQRVPYQEIMGAEPGFYARDGIFFVRRAYLLAMLAMRAGDLAEAGRIAEQLTTNSDPRDRHSYLSRTANVIRAELLRAQKEPAKALAALGEPREHPYLPSALEYSTAHERFLRAELSRELGKWSDALRWYGTFPDPGAYDLPYLPAVRAGEGAAHEGLGHRDMARMSYERAIALLSSADAEFEPALAAARKRVAALR
jgi:DNA-binding SARP family transcriptional activator